MDAVNAAERVDAHDVLRPAHIDRAVGLNEAIGTSRAGRTCGTLGTCRACRTLRAGRTGRTLNTCRARRTCRAGRPRRALGVPVERGLARFAVRHAGVDHPQRAARLRVAPVDRATTATIIALRIVFSPQFLPPAHVRDSTRELSCYSAVAVKWGGRTRSMSASCASIQAARSCSRTCARSADARRRRSPAAMVNAVAIASA